MVLGQCVSELGDSTVPLSAVLPARPVAPPHAIQETPFRPRVSEAGRRHPVTDGLQPGPEPEWGRWYRHLRSEARGGTTVMEAPQGAPLLQLDRVGQGRVALLLSDHIWLWARGHEGGGPQQELLRRMAHGLMREPELEEEDLTARIEAGRMQLVRRLPQARHQRCRRLRDSVALPGRFKRRRHQPVRVCSHRGG